MLELLRRVTIKTRILTLNVFYIFIIIIMAGSAIIEMDHIGDQIKEVAEQNIPLARVGTKITQRRLEQAILFERTIRFAETGNSEGFEQEKKEFKLLGGFTDEAMDEGSRQANEAIKNALTKETHNKMKKILKHLEEIEVKHEDYEKHVFKIFRDIDEKLFGKSRSDKEESGQKTNNEVQVSKGKGDKLVVKLTGLGKENFVKQVEKMSQKIKEKETSLNSKVEEFLDEIETFTKQSAVDAKQDLKRSLYIQIILTIGGIIFGLFMGIMIQFFTTKTVKETSDDISHGANQIAASSTQISSASQKLAEDASTQATSIEETSASLEEIAALTHSNSQNATEANVLVEKSGKIIEVTDRSIIELSDSTDQLVESGEKFTHLIKYINDTIAQINLLAISANTEAARSEATRSFALVAIEIKNLVQQAMMTSKEAIDQINGFSHNIKKGNKVAETAKKDFKDIVEINGRLKHLVRDVAKSSKEQSEGIDVISETVATLSTITRSNASSSEESAAAGEELNAMAKSMQEVVKELVILSGGAVVKTAH